MPVVYSFRFRGQFLVGRKMYRPLLLARLQGPSGSAWVWMLLDSGADCSLISMDLAHGPGLAIGEAHGGLGTFGRAPMGRAHMVAAIRHALEWLPSMTIPVEVPLQGAPPLPVLGREGVFDRFDVLFRLGPAPSRGMFYLIPRSAPETRRILPRHATGRGRRETTVGG